MKSGSEDRCTVICKCGTDGSKATECWSDLYCTGNATFDCLDHRGCATVCNFKVSFTTSIASKYLNVNK
jgi:hypothetical protein